MTSRKITQSVRAILRWSVFAAVIGVLTPGCGEQNGSAADRRPDGKMSPVIVLAGGGDEGPIGDQQAWGARLFKHLLANGDVTGDKKIRVACVGRLESDSWPSAFWKSIGADDCVNLVIDTTEAADAPALDAQFEQIDAVFIKGGDQGKFYDLWNDRRIEACIRRVHDRGGGVGGTSAGAMSLAQFSLCGSTPLNSIDVLEDSHHKLLNDESDGGSAIHTDFLGFVPDAFVDTHVTQRGRLGRMLGTLARACEDHHRTDLLAIGLEARTGIVIRDGVATVIGIGAVDFVRPTEKSRLTRTAGKPLIWTDLAFDRLTDGWMLDLHARQADMKKMPVGTLLVDWKGSVAPDEKPWEVHGDDIADEQRFAYRVDRVSKAYEVTRNREPLPLSIGFVDAHKTEQRGWVHECIFRALFDLVGSTGFLIAQNGRLWHEPDSPALIRFGRLHPSAPDVATLVIVTRGVKARGLSPSISSYDRGANSLNAAALIGMRLHVLADSDENGLCYDTKTGDVVQTKATP